MKSQELINLIQGDKTKLLKWFTEFETKSNSINDWQTLLNYPLEGYSCQICHKIRNSIQSGLNYYFGVKHLNNSKFPSLGELAFKDAINYIQEGEQVREELTTVFKKVSLILYK